MIDETIVAKKKVGVWDDRPRFLGMFASYSGDPKIQNEAPRFGIGDHLITCPCGRSEQHSALHTIFAYVKVRNTLWTVSWPTWWDF